MKLQDITNMDKDDVLGMLGLEARRSHSNRLLTTLGTFGIGLLVGAGVAPAAGAEGRKRRCARTCARSSVATAKRRREHATAARRAHRRSGAADAFILIERVGPRELPGDASM